MIPPESDWSEQNGDGGHGIKTGNARYAIHTVADDEDKREIRETNIGERECEEQAHAGKRQPNTSLASRVCRGQQVQIMASFRVGSVRFVYGAYASWACAGFFRASQIKAFDS